MKSIFDVLPANEARVFDLEHERAEVVDVSYVPDEKRWHIGVREHDRRIAVLVIAPEQILFEGER